MAERRSLANSLSTPVPGVDSDLVRSFVTQNVSSERPIPEPFKPIETRPITNADSAPTFAEAESKPSPKKRKQDNRFQPVGLIPVTVRLRPEIAGALKRASLERELAGEDVFTQQRLVEQVLEPWLSSEGYL